MKNHCESIMKHEIIIKAAQRERERETSWMVGLIGNRAQLKVHEKTINLNGAECSC